MMVKAENTLPPNEKPITKCIACQKEAGKIGEVPYAYHFLGKQFSSPLDTGDLYECLTCGLWFKYPYITESELASYYSASSDEYPREGYETRPDFARAGAVLADSFPDGGKVLDVGCYRGEFLNSLLDRFIKYGVEPSSLGAKVASGTGIRILGKDVSTLGDEQFDAITLFDVFEHLTDPLGTLDILFAHLRPNGLLFIATGLADNPLFWRSGAKYGYVCIPEHGCFLTKKFLNFLSDRYLSKHQLHVFSRNNVDFRHRARAIAVNLVNSPMLFLGTKKRIDKWYLSRRLRVVASRGFLPVRATNDHALAVLHKNSIHG
jgi:SAM-dependent methyltransferase